MPSAYDLSSWITIADEVKKGECIRKVNEYIEIEKVSQPDRKYASVLSEILLNNIIQCDDETLTMTYDNIIQYQGNHSREDCVPRDASVGITLFHYSRNEWALVIGGTKKPVSQGGAWLPSEESKVYIVNIAYNPDFAETLLRIHNFCVFLTDKYSRMDEFNDYVNGRSVYDPVKSRVDHFAAYCRRCKQYAEIKEWDVKKEGLQKVREEISGKNIGRCDKEFTTAKNIEAEVEIGDLIEFELCSASIDVRVPYKHWAVVVGRFMSPTKEVKVYIVHYARADQEILLRFDKLTDRDDKMRINNKHDFRWPIYKKDVVKNTFGVLARVNEFMKKKPSYDVKKLNCEHMATFCRYGKGVSVQIDNCAIFMSGITLGMYCSNTVVHSDVYLAQFIHLFLVYLFSREESTVMFRTGVLVGVQSCILLAINFTLLRSGTHFLFSKVMSVCNKLKLVLVVSVLSYITFKCGENALISELGICYIAIARLCFELLNRIWDIFAGQVRWINKREQYRVKLGRIGLVTSMFLVSYRGVLSWLTGYYGITYSPVLNKIVLGLKYKLMHVVVFALLSCAAFTNGFNNFAPGIAVIFIVVLIGISVEGIIVGFDRFITYCLYGHHYSKTHMFWAAVYGEGEGITLHFWKQRDQIRRINRQSRSENFTKELNILFHSWLGNITSLTLRPVTCSRHHSWRDEEYSKEERIISFSSWLGGNISLRLKLKSHGRWDDELTHEKVTIFFPNWLIKTVSNFEVVRESKKYPWIQFTIVIFITGMALLEIGPEFALLLFATLLYLWSKLGVHSAICILLATLQNFVTSIITTESTTFLALSTYVVLAVALMCKLKQSQYHCACEQSPEHEHEYKLILKKHEDNVKHNLY